MTDERAKQIIQENHVWDSTAPDWQSESDIVASIKQAVAEEREACAVVAEEAHRGRHDGAKPDRVCQVVADLIRARSGK